MFGKVVIMLCGLIQAPGCIYGPSVEPEPDERLFAPQIVLEFLEPQMGTTVAVLPKGQCEIKYFTIGRIKDQNVDDTLYFRWFVDWEGPYSSAGRKREYDGEIQPLSNGSVFRTYPTSSSKLQYTLNIGDLVTKDPDIHTITFAVADRAFPSDSTIFFLGDADEGQVDVYQWTIELTEGGKCDDT